MLDAHGRVQLVRSIGRFALVDAYFGYVYERALDSAKTVREAARAALHGAQRERLLAAAAHTFEEGPAGERARLPELLASALGADARTLLEREHERQSAKRVRESIQAAIANLDLVGAQPVSSAEEDEGGATGTAGPTCMPRRVWRNSPVLPPATKVWIR